MNTETIRNTADQAYEKKQYRKAKKLYLKIIKAQPEEHSYLQLAHCEYVLRNHEEVEILAQKVLQKNPESAEAMLILAKSYLIREKLDDAESMANKFIALSDNAGQGHAVLAFIKLSNGAIDDSEKEVLKAIEIEPDSSYSHAVYGILLKSQDRKKEALREFRLAFKKYRSIGTLLNLVSQFIGNNLIKFCVLWVLLLISGLILMNGYILLGFSIYVIFLGLLNFRNGNKKLAWLGFGISVFFGIVAGFLIFR